MVRDHCLFSLYMSRMSFTVCSLCFQAIAAAQSSPSSMYINCGATRTIRKFWPSMTGNNCLSGKSTFHFHYAGRTLFCEMYCRNTLRVIPCIVPLLSAMFGKRSHHLTWYIEHYKCRWFQHFQKYQWTVSALSNSIQN